MGLLDALLAPARPVLAGSRVGLRMPRMRDHESWSRVRNESRDFLQPWEPTWTADELSRRAFRLRLARYAQEARERSGFTFFLVDLASDEPLGGATIGQIRRGVAQSCTLGYWMGERHAGRGLMREAVGLLQGFVFEVENLHRIEAACLPTNARSIALLERTGFRREGYLRKYLRIAGEWEDHHLYSLVAEDWRTEPSSEPVRSPLARVRSHPAAGSAAALDPGAAA